ncbi:MAG TPA: ATP-binding protein [Burkholderiales bacterium]|nr:ATP-binding protein [Burkholderiales bacterium]
MKRPDSATAASHDGTGAARAEELLRELVEATAPTTGEEFFHALVRNLARVLGVKYAFVTECADQPPTRLRTLAFWSGGEFLDNREYDLRATPCEAVINEARECCYPARVSDLFPRERALGAESYRGIPVLGAGGRVIGHLAFLDERRMAEHDIGWSLARLFAVRAGAELDRLRAERALRESEERYRLVVENQGDLVLKLDPARRLLFASPSSLEILAPDAALGEPLRLDIHEEDRAAFANAWMAVLEPPHASDLELRALTAAGWRWIAWRNRAMTGADGKVQAVVATGRDVTGRKDAETRASLQLEQLARLSRAAALGAMGTALAHELNQPLAALVTYAQACRRLLEKLPRDSAELREALDRIAANAARAGAILRNMRELLARRAPERRPVSLNDAVRNAARLAGAAARAQRARLRLLLEESLPPVAADPVQIEQVVLNLVSNGLDSIREGGGELREVVISTALGPEPGEVQLRVCDSGPGLAAGQRERLFDPFYTTRPGGLGMGLCICKGIVDAHGGRLEALDCDTGAMFRLALPALTQ